MTGYVVDTCVLLDVFEGVEPLMDLTEEDFQKPGIVFQIGTAPQRIDILSDVSGVRYEDAVRRAVTMQVDGLTIKVISLDDLIANKRATGRPKDLVDAMTLENLKEKEQKNG